jgi:hypothetical protein
MCLLLEKIIIDHVTEETRQIQELSAYPTPDTDYQTVTAKLSAIILHLIFRPIKAVRTRPLPFGQLSVALRTIVYASSENEECARRRKETLATEGTQEEWRMGNEEC